MEAACAHSPASRNPGPFEFLPSGQMNYGPAHDSLMRVLYRTSTAPQKRVNLGEEALRVFYKREMANTV